MATAFSDFGKDSSDLITKGFPTSGHKFLTETRTPNAVLLKATGASTSKGVSLTVEPEYKWQERNATLKAKFITDRTLEASVAVADVGTKGAKLEFAAKQDSEEKRNFSATASFVNAQTHLKAVANFPLYSKNSPTATVDAVFRYPDNMYWGANAKYTWGSSNLDWNARIQSASGDHTMALLLDNKKDSSDITFSWYQRVSDSVKYGLSFVAATTPSVTPTCTVASEYRVDPDTTVKGRFAVVRPDDGEPHLRLGLALNQKVSTHATVTVGADINASSILGVKKGADHSVGFEVKLN
jgi:hypothetical protein